MANLCFNIADGICVVTADRNAEILYIASCLQHAEHDRVRRGS